ncbi:MAG: DUF2892 domain-containing protein [Xanthomonadales bacterium]|nr:DUF2892 domain-containing protein [Xanthomonadales bacterium]MCB1627783.1 DUF2892 domain-containing protein [Xanthomonadales bacterium]MCB1641550.1 DUF2892 domain-containing protein [Xanthomonadales bacterium]
MKRNVGGIDRIARMVVGLLLIGWVLLLGGPIWAWIGVVPLATGLVGFCPVYPLFGFSSCPLSKS